MSLPPKIIILIGFQASTKSTSTKEILSNVPNAIVLSRDTEGGTTESLVPKAEKLLQDGKIVILDNTNLTKKTRKLFIDLAKKMKVKVDAHYFKTTIEDCQIRHLKRMYEKFGEIYQTGTSSKHKKDLPGTTRGQGSQRLHDPHCFGAVVLFKARKDLEVPTRDEGFSQVIMRDVPVISWDKKIFKNKAVFLDIDGTVRVTEHLPNKYPIHPDEVQLIHSAERMRDKLESYRKEGYKLIGVSNQSGIAKEIVTEQQVDEIFERTRSLLGYTAEEFPILYCPHRPAPITCFCRKPQSGMAMEAIMKLRLNPEECIMVGDMKTDEEMAKRLNIKYYDVNEFW
jgi:histidinol-phosphate phosphatase family protein